MIGAIVIVAALLGSWELYTDLGHIDDFILPAPSQIAQALADNSGLLWHNLKVTGGEVLLGIALAVIAALALALAIHLSRALRRSVYPLLVASQTIPIPIVAPLLVAWFGFSLAPKLLIVALISFFPIVVNTLDGLAGVDPDMLKLVRTLDASRWQTLRRIELPAALPGIFSGAKIAVAIAVIGAVFAEDAGSSDGLGHLILQAIPQLETALAYAAVVVLSAFAIVLFATLALLERRILPWARPSRGEVT